MVSLNSPDKRPFNEVADLGLAIRYVGEAQQQIHLGMLYKPTDEDALVLHQLTHLDVRSEIPSDAFRWLQVELDEVNRRILVGFCRLLADKKIRVTYGFTYTGREISPSGDFTLPQLGYGLTCATFVMAIFETCKIPLLKWTEWPYRADDLTWQRAMLEMMERDFGRMVASAMGQHLADKRFRPEEVAAGATSKDRPLDFDSATTLGAKIVRQLKRSYR